MSATGKVAGRKAPGGRRLMVAAVASLALLPASAVASRGFASGPAQTIRVGVSSKGVQANDGATTGPFSADMRFVGLASDSDNLVPKDTNHSFDVFVRDLQAGTTKRVSLNSSGKQGNDLSDSPWLSEHGRFVGFRSIATNLVPKDGNAHSDVFVRDLKKGKTSRVSVSSGGKQANGSSFISSMTPNARFIAFESYASNLVPGDKNDKQDIFIRNRETHKTSRVSVSSAEKQGNGTSYGGSLSNHGRFVAFESYASNLVPGDNNDREDVFLRDRKTGQTKLISLNGAGDEGNGDSFAPRISPSGRFVAYSSEASNLVGSDTNKIDDVFIWNRKTGITKRASVNSAGKQAVGGYSAYPWLSAAGRYVSFESKASNLVPGPDANGLVNPDIYVRDRATGKTIRVSVNSNGQQGNSQSDAAALSLDGSLVSFDSAATNLVTPDATPIDEDAFIRGPLH